MKIDLTGFLFIVALIARSEPVVSEVERNGSGEE